MADASLQLAAHLVHSVTVLSRKTMRVRIAWPFQVWTVCSGEAMKEEVVVMRDYRGPDMRSFPENL